MNRVYIVYTTQWQQPEIVGVYATLPQAEAALRDLTYNERLHVRIESHKVLGTWKATQVAF